MNRLVTWCNRILRRTKDTESTDPICGQQYYPGGQPLTWTMVPYICDRPLGHLPPHRHGAKVYCGAIYRTTDGLYYCNLDLNHQGLHGREPQVQRVSNEKMIDRLLGRMNGG